MVSGFWYGDSIRLPFRNNKHSFYLKIFVYTLGVTVIAALLWALSIVHIFILFLELFFLFYFLSRVGRKFVFLEILALIVVTQWLFAPMIAEIFDVEMQVPFTVYFAYAIPGTILYLAGLTFPLWKQKELDGKISLIFSRLSEKYRYRKFWGIGLMVLGFPFWIYLNSVSISLNYIFFLLSNLLMVGICLLIFTQYIWKWILISVGLILLVTSTFLNGMIGSVIIWLFIIGMIYSCKRPFRIQFVFKLMGFLVFVWILTVLQASKTEYRQLTWNIKKNEMTGYVNREIKQNPALFYRLIKEKIFDPNTLTKRTSIMGLANRMNEGYLVSLAMNYVPRKRNFGEGEATLYNSAIAFIPRILWNSKPVIGQAEFFKKYTGITLTKYNSTTIGPLGEAYVDFGILGVIFLGFFGLFIGAIFQVWVDKSLSQPVLFLWFIVLYFSSIAVTEVSISGFVNGVFKYIIFIFAVRLLLRLTGIKV